MTSPGWPILTDPLTPAVPVTVVTRAETGRSVDTAGITGRGLLRPFRRDQKRDFASGTGAELVAAQLGQVLGTICSSEVTGGELPWRTEFGSLLHLLRLGNMDPVLIEEARAFVGLAIQRWVPRVRITDIELEQNDFDTAIVMRISWDLQSEGSERLVVTGLETEIALG